MTTQALTLPVDIPWRRFAYSADMIDTDFGNLDLPPKWRSSLAVYYYVVPKEETAESYPQGRIVYLRLSCSITGWNLDEELKITENKITSDDMPNDLQHSVFQAFQAGALAEYSPCLSAIVQIAIYPHSSDNVGPDSFPYIFDFEPKKRELYETRSETGEYLSGSSNKLNVQKGTTTTESLEEDDITSGGGSGYNIGVGSFSFGNSSSWSGERGTRRSEGKNSVDMTTTDGLQEARATTSHTTSLNQMYQLFNGYHLGTNRAVFYIQARPHTITENGKKNEDPNQVEFNLINGERRLEGLQDMFLVVHIPDTLKGLCIQAQLDTGHTINIYEFPQSGSLQSRQLLVTRRVIQNCGRFNDAGSLVPSGVPLQPLPTFVVAFEASLENPITMSKNELARVPTFTHSDRVRLANELNQFQQQVGRKMLDGLTTARYQARPIEETFTFRLMVESVLTNINIEVDQLIKMGYLTKSSLKVFQQAGADTVADLFTEKIEKKVGPANVKLLHDTRTKLVSSIVEVIARARRDNYEAG